VDAIGGRTPGMAMRHGRPGGAARMTLYGGQTVLSKFDHRGNEAVRRPRELAREARQYCFPHCLTASVVNPFMPRARPW
jgi:hypothetical protein